MSTPTPTDTIINILDVQKEKGKVVLDCISNGLTMDDALTLAEWTNEDFELFKKTNERFAQLVERKKVEYKKALMTPITNEIKGGDAKLAQWMLERQFHNEFSSKKRPNEEPSNPISVIINQIQSGSVGIALIPPSLRLKRNKILEEENTQVILPQKSSPRGDFITISDEE